MTEYMRVNVCGRVTLAEERFSVGGRRLARLCVATGGDARKVGSVAQFDFYDEEVIPTVLACRREERVLVLGRLQGSYSDKGYWNGYLFGDAVFRSTMDPSTPIGYAEADEGRGTKLNGGAGAAKAAAPAPLPHEDTDDFPF